MDVSIPSQSGMVLITTDPLNAETPPLWLQAPITPVEHHYVRSHFSAPRHDGTLTVSGEVDAPFRLGLADLRALPATTLSVTLECAGNGREGFQPLPKGEPWGWTAVSTAVWTGVPLHALLAQARPRPEGRTLLFEGADHGPYEGGPEVNYTRALPRTEVERMGADILVAYEMNGEPLPLDHGAPLRLVVPGWYGMASVKWLQRVQFVPDPFSGPFQTDSYVYIWPDGTREPVTMMLVRALITDPPPGKELAREPFIIRGQAWSGRGSVTAVEVSIDCEEPWQPAQLAAPVSPNAWQAWSFEWTPQQVGRHSICARARDSSGATQPDCPAWNRKGYGNHAVQPRFVDVH
jgi:DMSO/TMAO reductase YedYZ molybdopterin-dependent catalytic subunit